MSSITYTEFEQQVVFVTGANSGIGKAQAEAFLVQGARVFGVDLETDQMALLKAENPHSFYYRQGDVRQANDLENGITACRKELGEIDILLNTAGKLDDYRPLLETTEELWELIYQTNVKSQFQLTKRVLPQMVERNRGVIINMASIAGLIAGGGGIAYTSAKHAIVGFTKQLALDYAAQGIRIKAIAPGAIDTPMNAADFAGEGQMAAWVAQETPVKRWAKPEEVADLTLFLASEQASYLQGNVVTIDGGWMLK